MENTIKEKQRYFLLLLSTLSLLFSNQLNAQNFKHLGIKEGLSQLSVLSIYQDELGRMWFGTREGVNVYDGKHINIYKPWTIDMSRENNNLPAGNVVKTIVGNKHGDIYMDVDGALVRYDLQKEKFVLLKNSGLQTLTTEGDEVWSIVGDSLYLCKSDSLAFQQKINIPYISCLWKSGNTLWVGTHQGLYLYENKIIKKVLPSIWIYALFKSSHGDLWIASLSQGLYRITKSGEVLSEPHFPDSGEGVISNQIRYFTEDEQENIWFGTFEGLQMYNPYNKKYSAFRKKDRIGSLTHSSVFPVYKDNQGSIWLGTYYGGVHYFNPQKDIFTYYPYDSQRDDCLNFPLIGSMVEDKDKNLWICTDGGGVNRLNRKTGEFTYFTSSQKNSILHNNIKCICYDEKRDCIYIGTYVGGFSRYDRKTGKFYNYLEDYNKTIKGPNREVLKLLVKDDWLYIIARNGFWKMDIESGEFHFICYISASDFIIATDGTIWFATDTGVYRMNMQPPYSPVLFKLEEEGRKFRISKIIQGSTGTIYFSTVGNGFYSYDEKEKNLIHYTVNQSNLLSNYCYTMVETSSNNILITHERGISMFSPFNLSINSVEMGENNGITTIIDGCGAYISSDEQIFLGGVDGMISFRESDLNKKYKNNGNLYFSALQIHNTRIYPDDVTGVLKQSLPFVRDLELSASQNNIIISFSSSNYLSINSNTRYEYKLEGFDQDWAPTAYMNLHYTNIPPGKYILRLREKPVSKNNNLSDEQQEISLNIVVHNPWYNTVWAWLCYVLIVAGSVYGVWHVKMGRKMLALSLEQEKKEKVRNEELNQTKLRFFMNISHEFRTLLTLIIGQIELLMQIHKLPPSVYNRLLKIHKNAIHMRILITELLDFRKLEQGHMRLKITFGDIVAVTKEVYLSFYELAQKKNITYLFEHGNDSLNMWFDPVQMQKVLFNLISNAFKYTSDKGKIQIFISKTDKNVLIEVKDTGCGISQEVIDKIFERFYQVNDSHSGLTTGTGIGLSLAKGIVDAHKGNISVASEVGKGSTFTVSLLLGNAHFSQEEMSTASSEMPQTIDENEKFSSVERDEIPSEVMEETEANDTGEETREKPTILIVEDNLQLIEMLEDIFSPIYNVYKAFNGAEGFDMTRQIQPDIVLSDVMMPVMSGKEMCHKIKSNFEVSHIPVVLLTAQTTVEYMIDSYMFGVDDYITKPFNVKLLISRCNNLVNSRRALLERFKNMEKIMAKSVDGLNASDQKLIDEANAVIRKNFDNFDFDLNLLASELNMGRSKMFSRIKEITGITPNEYVLNMKLKEAGRLLKEVSEYNVAEVAYTLGFSSPRYFSKCFKSFYGVTPQAFRKSQGENSSEEDELTNQ